MMDDLSVRMTYDGPTLMKHLRDVVQSDMPVGVLEGGDMAMSTGVACDRIRQWLSEHLDDIADRGLNDGQKMYALGNVLGVATLQTKAVSDASLGE